MEKLPKSRCEKLVETYTRTPKVTVAAKGASTKYWSEYLIEANGNERFHFLFIIMG